MYVAFEALLDAKPVLYYVRDACCSIVARSDYNTRKKKTFLNDQLISQSPIQRSSELGTALDHSDCPSVVKSVLVWMINPRVLSFRTVSSHDAVSCL